MDAWRSVPGFVKPNYMEEKIMKRRLIPVASVIAVFMLATALNGSMFSVNAFAEGNIAQTPKPVKEHAQKGKGGGEDPNITNDSDSNDPNSMPKAPGYKGGERPRGAGYCRVGIDNWTGWYIRVYVDGTYRGTIAPWDESHCYTGSGPTKIYAVAVFEDGSRFTWGPRVVNCSRAYNWELHP